MAAPTPVKSQVLTPFFGERPAGGRGGGAAGLLDPGCVALGVGVADGVAGTAEGVAPVAAGVGPAVAGPAALSARSGPRVIAMTMPASTASTTNPAAAIAVCERRMRRCRTGGMAIRSILGRTGSARRRPATHRRSAGPLPSPAGRRGTKAEAGVTDRAAFTDSEWDLLVELPRWVAQAASAAEPNNARQASAEEESGLLAIADGRQSASPLVAELARQLVNVYDEPRPGAVTIDFRDVAAGLATVLERAREVSQLLVAKMDAADAGAYRQWLLAITDTVI